jgi:hypothetical protein
MKQTRSSLAGLCRPTLSKAFAAAALAAAAGLAHATPSSDYGSRAEASASGVTNTVFWGVCDDNYPCFDQNHASDSSGSSSRSSATASGSATSGPGTSPEHTHASAFASVSVSSGHVGLSFSADANGIGYAVGSGSASWHDLLTVGGPAGQDVVVRVSLGITAEFVGLGGGPGSSGGADVQACWTSPVYLCTSGSDGVGAPLLMPATVTADVHLRGGSSYAVTGTARGAAVADSGDYGGTSNTISWSMLATNSAHFSMESLTPGVSLTLASGCSITSGYGCDPIPVPVPEPASPLLWVVGLAGIAIGAHSRRRRG